MTVMELDRAGVKAHKAGFVRMTLFFVWELVYKR